MSKSRRPHKADTSSRTIVRRSTPSFTVEVRRTSKRAAGPKLRRGFLRRRPKYQRRPTFLSWPQALRSGRSRRKPPVMRFCRRAALAEFFPVSSTKTRRGGCCWTSRRRNKKRRRRRGSKASHDTGACEHPRQCKRHSPRLRPMRRPQRTARWRKQV